MSRVCGTIHRESTTESRRHGERQKNQPLIFADVADQDLAVNQHKRRESKLTRQNFAAFAANLLFSVPPCLRGGCFACPRLLESWHENRTLSVGNPIRDDSSGNSICSGGTPGCAAAQDRR